MTTSEERKAEFVEGYEKWFALLAAARNLIAAAKRVTPDTSQWKDEMTPLLKAVEALPAPKRYTMPDWDELTYEQQARMPFPFRPTIYKNIREVLAVDNISPPTPLIPTRSEIEFMPPFSDWACRVAEVLTPKGGLFPNTPEGLKSYRELLAANLRQARQEGFDEAKHIYSIFPT